MVRQVANSLCLAALGSLGVACSDGSDQTTLLGPDLPGVAQGTPEVVAKLVENGMPEEAVRRRVESRIQGRDLGYLGEPTVNVLQLNLALAGLRR